MRWRGGRRSGNIQDRRGMGGPVAGGGGLLVLALVVFLMGGDPTRLLIEGAGRTIQAHYYDNQPIPEEEQEAAEFVSVVLAETEDTWHTIFNRQGLAYKEPVLVLFSGIVQSGCGMAQSAVGPFYCPLDHKLYIDLSFFNDLKSQLGAPGDFAQAYVVAHEVGHHVQTLLGVRKPRSNSDSVRMELQADCYSGVWAHSLGPDILEDGDIEEAMNAASQIGDDRLQQQSQGHVVPDSFTHGSSRQRQDWFRRGYESGDIAQCDTFKAKSL